jgi:hypothetical protein
VAPEARADPARALLISSVAPARRCPVEHAVRLFVAIVGTYGRNAMLAFEVDHVDYERHVGWSVVARGRGWAEVEPEQISRIREAWQPRPWVSGNRNLYLRIRWESLTGRQLGADWTRVNESPVHRTLTAL